jgi:hypothetical protein
MAGTFEEAGIDAYGKSLKARGEIEIIKNIESSGNSVFKFDTM